MFELILASNLHSSSNYWGPQQGIFSHTVTSTSDQSFVRIYVEKAAGPYKAGALRHHRGLHSKIAGEKSILKKGRAKNIYRNLQCAPHHVSTWTILLSFAVDVEKPLVIIAHAVMTVLFQGYENGPYLRCRPPDMPLALPTWGLNHIGPLGQDGLTEYKKHYLLSDPNEAEFIRHATSASAKDSNQKRSLLTQRKRIDRLINGGQIHVNVLKISGIVRRFFFTALTKSEGSHIDITVPIDIGIKHGLEEHRTLQVVFDVAPTTDHQIPYAIHANPKVLLVDWAYRSRVWPPPDWRKVVRSSTGYN